MTKKITFLLLMAFIFVMIFSIAQKPLLKPFYIYMRDLMDFKNAPPSDNMVLAYDSASRLWVPATNIELGNTGLVIGSSTPFSDSSGTLTLQNIDALDATTTATLLGEMTAETQHRIGCLTVSDLSYVKTLFLTVDASGPTSMRTRDLWYMLSIEEITGTWAGGDVEIKAKNDTLDNPKLPYGYLMLKDNYTSVDTMIISGSDNNDGIYTLRQDSFHESLETPKTDADLPPGEKETYIYIYPTSPGDIGGLDEIANGDVVNIQDLKYMVPTGHVFLAGRVSSTLTHGYDRGLIGEADDYNGAITKPQMCFGNGDSENGHPAGESADIPGVFTEEKYINVDIAGSFSVYVPTVLYGVEVEINPDGTIKDDVTVQFNIGGYICEDYRDLKVLIATGNIGSSAVSFHHWNGSSFNDAYVIPGGSIYIAGIISYWTEGSAAAITLGESLTDNGSIQRKVLSCGNTDIYSGLQDIYGIFGYSPVSFTGAVGKFVSARCSQYNMRLPTYIYGVEIVN